MFFISCSSTKSCIDPSGKANLCTFFILFLQKAARVLSPPLWICIFVVPKKILSSFLSSTSKLKSSARSFDLKFYRLTKINGKAENYAISTQQQPSRQLQISTRWRHACGFLSNFSKVTENAINFRKFWKGLFHSQWLFCGIQRLDAPWITPTPFFQFENPYFFLTSGSWKIWFCTLLHANETQHRLTLLIIV